MIHHDKHHAAYVNNLNEVLKGKEEFLNMELSELMQRLGQVPEDILMKVRNNGGGVINHIFFWQIMAPAKNEERRTMNDELKRVLEQTFGSLEKFQDLFSASAMGRFGSGWAWLVAEKGRLAIMDTPNQDTPLSAGKTPILALDVWEHAYYLKYQNRRADYINAWWNVVSWQEVGRRFLETK